MKNLKKVMAAAIVQAGVEERVEDGEVGITLSVLARVLTPELVAEMERAIMRDRLGIDPEYVGDEDE